MSEGRTDEEEAVILRRYAADVGEGERLTRGLERDDLVAKRWRLFTDDEVAALAAWADARSGDEDFEVKDHALWLEINAELERRRGDA